jgi:hypothetical protein
MVTKWVTIWPLGASTLKRACRERVGNNGKCRCDEGQGLDMVTLFWIGAGVAALAGNFELALALFLAPVAYMVYLGLQGSSKAKE